MMTEERYFDLISGRRTGVLAATARAALKGASCLYGSAMRLRNGHYNRTVSIYYPPVPTFSIGNLTVGGTGKTPMAVWLCQYLASRQVRPAVLSRGYKADAQNQADELLMLSYRCPSAVAIGHPDRKASAKLAVEQYHAKAIVLDDGFQHRKLFRDLDMVLIDATRPFGFGHVLPRGLLREPMSGLARAEWIVLTRCDQASEESIATIRQTVRQYNSEATVSQTVHRPEGWQNLMGQPLTPPTDLRVGAFAGIARPDAFLATLIGEGIEPMAKLWGDDHHRYSADDVAQINRWASEHRLDAVVTTEKDGAKLRAWQKEFSLPVFVLTVAIAWLNDDETRATGMIDAILAEHELSEHDQDSEQA